MAVPLIRVLALDSEVLIALDVQFLLSGRPWCEVDVGVMRQLDDMLDAATSPYDVVLIEADRLGDRLPKLLAQLDEIGCGVVLGAVEETLFGTTTEGLAGIPMIVKPYTEESLLAAFVRALETSQPKKARDVTAAVVASGP